MELKKPQIINEMKKNLFITEFYPQWKEFSLKAAKLIKKSKIKREEKEREVYIGHSLMLKGLWIVKFC